MSFKIPSTEALIKEQAELNEKHANAPLREDFLEPGIRRLEARYSVGKAEAIELRILPITPQNAEESHLD